MAARIRKGDTVVVIAGADRGQTGEVLRVIPDENRAVVRGVRIATKHTKATGMGQQGGIVRVEAPIHMSNLQPADPANGKPTRVKFRIDGDKKVRVAKSGQVIPDVVRTGERAR